MVGRDEYEREYDILEPFLINSTEKVSLEIFSLLFAKRFYFTQLNGPRWSESWMRDDAILIINFPFGNFHEKIFRLRLFIFSFSLGTHSQRAQRSSGKLASILTIALIAFMEPAEWSKMMSFGGFTAGKLRFSLIMKKSCEQLTSAIMLSLASSLIIFSQKTRRKKKIRKVREVGMNQAASNSFPLEFSNHPVLPLSHKES